MKKIMNEKIEQNWNEMNYYGNMLRFDNIARAPCYLAVNLETDTRVIYVFLL